MYSSDDNVTVIGSIWIVLLSKQGHALPFGTAYYTISVVVNVLLTTLIALRLFMHRRTIISVLPSEHARQYTSLVAIIIESAALHTVFALVFVITYGLNSPVNQVMVGFASAAQVGNLGSWRYAALTPVMCAASSNVSHPLPRCRREGVAERKRRGDVVDHTGSVRGTVNIGATKRRGIQRAGRGTSRLT